MQVMTLTYLLVQKLMLRFRCSDADIILNASTDAVIFLNASKTADMFINASYDADTSISLSTHVQISM